MKTGKLFFAVALLFVSLLLGGCGDDKPNIAYFKGERLMKESPQIEAIIKEGEDKMKALQEEAIKLSEEGPLMTEEEIIKKQQEFQTRAQRINSETSERLRSKVTEAITELQKTKKFDVVMQNDKGAKLVITGGMDITEDLIEKLK